MCVRERLFLFACHSVDAWHDQRYCMHSHLTPSCQYAEDFDLMSVMTALEHVGRDDVNCVTVAVDGVRLHKPTKEWHIDKDIEYQR